MAACSQPVLPSLSICYQIFCLSPWLAGRHQYSTFEHTCWNLCSSEQPEPTVDTLQSSESLCPWTPWNHPTHAILLSPSLVAPHIWTQDAQETSAGISRMLAESSGSDGGWVNPSGGPSLPFPPRPLLFLSTHRLPDPCRGLLASTLSFH